MGKVKFTSEWLSKTDAKGFVVSSWGKKYDDQAIFCFICNKHFQITKGLQSINQHVMSQKHGENIKVKLKSAQLRLTSVPANSANLNNNQGQLLLTSIKDCITKAEMLWCVKIVICNMSANSCENIAELFRCMFDCAITETFTLSPKKASYIITEALGPYFRDCILRDLGNSYYSIMYDETTNVESEKELQIVIRYWSEHYNKIFTHHLESFFIGSAKATDIAHFIKTAIENANLSLTKLLTLGSDGPNVNKKVFALINEEVDRKLINIGTCNLHTVHNSFKHAVDEFGSDVSTFLLGVYYFFDGWPLRKHDFNKIQDDLKLPRHAFIKYVPSRWLSVEPAVARVLEQYEALKNYFLRYVPTKQPQLVKAKYYKDIFDLLKLKDFKAQLRFLQHSSLLFINFSQIFQKNEPMIHILYTELKQLGISLLSRIIKKEILPDFENINLETLFNSENLLPPEKISCGIKTIDELKSLTEREKLSFLRKVQTHYITAGRHFFKSAFLPSVHVIKYFRFLLPKNIKNDQSLKDIIKIADKLPCQINIDTLIDEFKLLQLETVPPYHHDEERIDEYWQNIIVKITKSEENGMNKLKFAELLAFVKCCLSLPHGNADVERGFSLSGRTLTEDKASMSVRMFNARLYISDAVKQFYNNRPELIFFSKELINLGQSACKSYNLYLENQKKMKIEELERSRLIEEERLAEEDRKTKIKVQLKSISSLELNLKDIKIKVASKTKITNQLFKEANERLTKAIDKKNFEEISIAQALLDSAQIARKAEMTEKKKQEEIQRDIERKRKQIIECNSSNKKPKK